jgi:3' terminal RNA ribose 2'-O-methyltransferase Hen1
MFLTLTTTHHPATDLGFLLHKHPDRSQTFEIAAGQAHVFYPEAAIERTVAALILDVDPVGLVRGRPDSRPDETGKSAGLLSQYVNDRPYVASSFLSVALNRVFGSALGGRCETRPELTTTDLPLAATFGPVRAKGGPELIRRLFEPLGYRVTMETSSPPATPPSAECWTVSIAGSLPLQRLLTHVYVLLPVLDDQKHYWVSDDEIDKLLRRGADWLPSHPDRELIARRYLKHGRRLTRIALDRLAELDDMAPTGADADEELAEIAAEQRTHELRLHDARLAAVLERLRASGARRVLDLGCGEGKLLRLLLRDQQFEQVVGVDASAHVLALARDRLELDRMPERQRHRLTLLQSALTYRDRRLAGFDAAALVEVIEHIDPERMPSFERALFGFARPATVVITTPNREYNVGYASLAAGSMRHLDHRFEWTRPEFRAWADRVAAEHGYAVELTGIGEVDAELGQPTQMAVFRCI